MADSRNLYFLHIFYLIHAEYDFIFSDSSNKCYFHIFIFGESQCFLRMSILTVHQSNEIDKTIVLSFGKCSDAKTCIKMSSTAVNLTNNI